MSTKPAADGTIKELLETVLEGDETTLKVIRDLDNAGLATLRVERRKLLPQPPEMPKRCESPRRSHWFHDIDTLVAFLQKYGGENTVALADVSSQIITATLDDTAPEGFETVSYRPIVHPVFESWNAIIGKASPVLAFAKHCMTHRRTIIKPNGRDVAWTFSQITATSVITSSRGQGSKSINGVMIETKVQGKSTSVPVDLPESITIFVPLFIDSDPVEIEIDLLVDVKTDGTVEVTACAADLLDKQVQTFLEHASKLASAVGGVGGLGSIGYKSWDVLR